jgi:acetolactate synthase-1/3 small subunit
MGVEKTNGKKHTISLHVGNKPGVLNRIAQVFARRGYNIDSLVVSEAHDPAFSRMTIAASGDEKTLDQILKQLNKLLYVVHAVDHTGENVVERELALIKVRCKADVRAEVMDIGHAFKCAIVDISENSMSFEVTGRTEKLDALLKMFDKFGVIEMVRTGRVLIARGEESTT